MGVPLQLILGFCLALSQCSAKDWNHRTIREAPPPPFPIQSQNVTEINNRDLNKIVKDHPKTDILETKLSVNNVNNFDEFPLKLAKSQPYTQSVHKNETQEEKKEDGKKTKLIKDKSEKVREENSRSIDASKYWSSEFHNRNNVFTLPQSTDIEKFHQHEDMDSGMTQITHFDNFELTTPSTKIFDQKFKETVESVEQKLEEVELEHEDSEMDSEESKDEEFNSDDLLKNPHNGNLEFVKTRTIVNNETVDKNSIHKDLNIEQSKKVNFELIHNDTMTYYDSSTKGDAFESSTTRKNTPVSTTRKSSFTKPSSDKNNANILDNKIESETIKAITGNNLHTTTKKYREVEVPTTSMAPALQTTTTSASTTTLPTTNISEQENNVIPLTFVSESSPVQELSTELTTGNKKERQEQPKPTDILSEHTTVSSTSTDIPASTSEIRESTRLFEELDTTAMTDATVASVSATTVIIDETTVSVIAETTTEESRFTTDAAITTIEIKSTTGGHRTSKSLESNIVTEQMFKTSENMLDITTVEDPTTCTTEVSFKDGSDSTTVIDNKKTSSKQNTENETATTTTEELGTTEDMLNMYTTTMDFDVLDTTVVLITTEEPETSTESKTTNQKKDTTEASTEFAFIHIENTGSNHTTLTPELLSPNFNYSTPVIENNSIGVRTNLRNTSNASESTTREPVTSEVPSVNISSTTEGSLTDTSPTENSFSKGDGGNKGKIAAIAISCVGAVCLILLAGLLYVMKKRQRRLNYGPRCRPVSLDDYSIDNLSVYNSVRGRKGAARMSKRSFGNPAFEDPAAPTHPLNFPALAKFASNYEDIKAEFEEIPQISARTSELPEGCETKNRYANVIPLPETRVYLKPIDGYPNSDYINANYVTGPKNTKGYYIATQGPMQNTVDEFWRMIWEQQAKVILMLTHLVENGLEKCVDYLPESEVVDCSRLFGDFQITLKKQEVKEKYIISSLQLKNMVSNSWREVTHFWYLGWPEKGVPVEANSLIAFLIEARSYMKTATIDKRDGINGIQNGRHQNEHNPVVVHCSPGTGRTGVAIASDIAIREFETSRLVDIPKIVYRIRRDRANAVQTREQYQFIYMVVSLYATKLTGGALDNF